jgi:hypothetical protein
MKYCPHCRRWNRGAPVYCNYCGRTWAHRLCPRGHENPADAQFCNQCGRPNLTQVAGTEPLVARIVGQLPLVFKAALFLVAVGTLFSALCSLSIEQLAAFVIAGVMLLAILRSLNPKLFAFVVQTPLRILGQLVFGMKNTQQRRR